MYSKRTAVTLKNSFFWLIRSAACCSAARITTVTVVIVVAAASVKQWLQLRLDCNTTATFVHCHSKHGVVWRSSRSHVAIISTALTFRSAATNPLIVPSSVTLHCRHSTYSAYSAYPAAASSIWNSLPENVVSALTLQSFQHHLKTFLFQRSFPDTVL